MHRWYPKTPYLRQGPNRRQVAGLRLAQALLVECGLPETDLLPVLGVEGFGRVEMEPAQHNALDQEPLKRGRLRAGQLLGERRAFPVVRFLREEIVTADRLDKGLPCRLDQVPHGLPIARDAVHP